MRNSSYVMALLAASAILILFKGEAMAFDQKVLFSEVKGVVLQSGQPVEGAEVQQNYHWHWKDKKASEKTLTDKAGRFAFPVVQGSAWLGSLFPHEPVVTQEIYIQYQGEKYEAWLFSKHNYQLNGELKRPIELICELSEKPDFRGEKVYGICTFK